MPKTPTVTPDDVHRFDAMARIQDRDRFAAELTALVQEKMVEAQRARASSVAEQLVGKARELRVDTHWKPSITDLQRGRNAMLQDFEQPQNLPLPEFARLAHKSRQQIYKDLAARPRRLLALSMGARKQRLPEWQLNPLRLRLTREVLKQADDVDAWTLFHALSDPLGALDGRSPVDAVTPANLNAVTLAVLAALGVHGRPTIE